MRSRIHTAVVSMVRIPGILDLPRVTSGVEAECASFDPTFTPRTSESNIVFRESQHDVPVTLDLL
jgi:hypothetical protein